MQDYFFDFFRFFSIFFVDEPTTVAAGGYTFRHPAIIKQVEDIIDDGVSVIAVDPDRENKLVGMMLAHIVEKSDDMDPRLTFEDYHQTYPELHSSIMTLFDEIMYPGDLFDSHPGDTKFYDMFTLATHPDIRGRGIGRHLVEQSLVMAQKAQCSAAIVLATNDLSRRIFDKLGMQVIATKHWNECMYNKGQPAFGQVPSAMASAHYLKI